MLQLLLVILLLIATPAQAFIGEIREEDGSPSSYPYALKVTNGSLTDNGDGTVSITTGGGGGGSMAIGSTVTSGTTGSALFVGSGPVLAQDNANFFWDDTNNRLGIGTASPSAPIHINGTGTATTGNFLRIINTADYTSSTESAIYVRFGITGGGIGRAINIDNPAGTTIFYIDYIGVNAESFNSTPSQFVVKNNKVLNLMEGFGTIQKSGSDIAFATSNNLLLNPAATYSVIVTPGSSASKGLIVKGAASQSANLQEWQNSSGTIQAQIKPDGSAYFNGPVSDTVFSGVVATGKFSLVGGQGYWAYRTGTAFDYNLDVYNGGTPITPFRVLQAGTVIFNEGGRDADFRIEGDTDVNLFFVDASTDRVGIGTNAPAHRLAVVGSGGEFASIRTTSTTQFASFQAINNSSQTIEFGRYSTSNSGYGAIAAGDAYIYGSTAGFAITAEGASGVIKFATGSSIPERMRIDAAGLVGIGITPTAQLHVSIGAAATIGSIIKGAASQTANLTEWQNSSATVLASVSSAGNITGANLSGTNTGDEPTATSSSEGVVELAIASEVDTGTDTSRAITPDALAGSNLGEKAVSVYVVAAGTATAVGDGKAYFNIPSSVAGMDLVEVHAHVITAGTTGTTDIQIHNLTSAVDMLSTKLTVDSAETSSSTAAAAAVINASNDDVVANELIRIDIDAISTTPAQGLVVTLVFRLP